MGQVVNLRRIGNPLITLLAIATISLGLTGCRQDMHDQPKYKYLRPTEFFPDGRSARPLLENTVARGHLEEDTVFYTGMVNGQPTTDIPIEVTREVIDRGQERFNIYCSPCHGQLGNGLGMIVQRGFKQPPSYHSDRLRQAPIGHFFDVMTNGYGAMWKYAQQVEPRDRWAIAAYIRVLQASQNANINDLSAQDREKLPAEKQMAEINGPGQQGTPGQQKNVPANATGVKQ